MRRKLLMWVVPVFAVVILHAPAAIAQGESRFSLSCHVTLPKIQNRISPDGYQDWDLSVFVSGNRGRVYRFAGSEWATIGVSVDKLISHDEVGGDHGEVGSGKFQYTETISRITGDYLQILFGANGQNAVSTGKCHKISWKAPPETQF